MTALSTAELSSMRSAIGELFPDVCTILSVTNTPDGMGGQTQTWGTVSSGVACRLDVISGMENVSGGAVMPFTKTVLSLPYDTTIDNAYRVTHGGVTYAVTGSNNDQSWIAVKRVDLEKV